MRCELSKVGCSKCYRRSSCLMYSERKVLKDELKRLLKKMDNVRLIAKAIVKRDESI